MTDDRVKSLRAWLLSKPRPTSLRVTVGTAVSLVTMTGQTFAQIARSLDAMDPDLIEALDQPGNVIRARRADSDDDDQEDAGDELEQPPAPTAAELAQLDPETRRFQIFASELGKAYVTANGVAGELVAMMRELGGTLNAQRALLDAQTQNMLADADRIRQDAQDARDAADEERERAREERQKSGLEEDDIFKSALKNVVEKKVASALDGDDKPTTNGAAHTNGKGDA
jgi:hypothetical protein